MAGNSCRSELWGLDPVFHTYAKLYIRDVLNLKPSEDNPEVFQHGNHPIMKVDILGVVVRVDQKNRSFTYALDDGTGVITCVWFKPSENFPSNLQGTLCPELSKKLSEVQQLEERALDGYSHGDLLHIRGRAMLFSGHINVRADQCALEDDPNKETERMMLLPELYKKCYTKTVPLLRGIANLTDENGMKQISLVSKLETVIMSHVTATTRQEITKTDVLLLDEARNLLQISTDPDKIVDLALTSLQNSGQLFQKVSLNNNARNIHIVTANCKDLEDTILQIIRSWQGTERSGDCPASHIFTRVNKLLQYSKLGHNAYTQCLNKLESQSDIISTADKCYIVFDDT